MSKHNHKEAVESEEMQSHAKEFPVKELTKDEIIEMYKDEIAKKEKIIHQLEAENKLLLDLSMKNAKRRLEELEGKFKETEGK